METTWQDYSVDRSLKFRDPALERAYQVDYARGRLFQTRLALCLGILLYSSFIILDWFLLPRSDLGFQAAIRLGVVTPFLVGVLAYSFAPSFVYNVRLCTFGCIAVCGLGHSAMAAFSNLPPNYLLCVTCPMLVMLYTYAGMRFIHATIFGLVYIAVYEATEVIYGGAGPKDLLFINYIVLSVNFMGVLASYSIERMSRTVFRQRLQLEAEGRRSERLLLNILPTSIADRLKAGEQTIADGISEATVLFADVVNFTLYCSDKSPAQTLGVLDTIFSAFDALADKYGLEKIKTVGDCYMVAAGVPVPRTDHVQAIADCALEMREVLSQCVVGNGDIMTMRFGINTGPVVAGVIGKRKFIYDLWGDAVNVASRMEENSLPNKILITQATRDKLQDGYRVSDGRQIHVKGKGLMTVYALEGRREEVQAQG